MKGNAIHRTCERQDIQQLSRRVFVKVYVPGFAISPTCSSSENFA